MRKMTLYLKNDINNYLINFRPQIVILLSNSRPHTKSGVAYKKNVYINTKIIH